ncbi:MAG: low-specificity L-threonine aldolase [Termitinemataceae bacterium]|nr:MAG: low-specificity L-threonine aldolase [Termitinemataceae bacterium]
MIDLRSDTVTNPSDAMRSAMAAAEVGDDVYGDDPTVNKLQTAAAKMLGKEAALFVPSGTFGNQLALFTWCLRGSEVILGEECHIIAHEAGASSVIAGVQLRQISAPDGAIAPDEIKKRIRSADLHSPATSLICMENAHSNGKAVPLDIMSGVYNAAKEHNLPVHLDGARIFNAAAALNCDAKDIAANADSVMFCISKGLCAPVGSILAGTKKFVDAARLKRKILGGGLRQAGILAAAGLIAINEMSKRLGEDHKRARKLENALTKIKGIKVETGNNINMVFFSCDAAKNESQNRNIVEQFKERSIVISEAINGMFRFATHYWIGDNELQQVIKASNEIFGNMATSKSSGIQDC